MIDGRMGLNENYQNFYLNKLNGKIKRNIKNFLCYYPDANCLSLKQKLAKKYNISEENIFISNGSDEVLLVIATIFKEYKNYITTKNVFCSYKNLSKLFNKNLIEIDLKDNVLNYDDFESKIVENSLVFIANPSNPLGTFIEKSTMLKILELCKEKNCLLVVDEAYNEFAEFEYPNQYCSMLNEICDNLIVTRTFSKFYGVAGVRCGCAYSSKKNIEKINEIKNVLVYSVNSFALNSCNYLLEFENEKQNLKIYNSIKNLKYDLYNFCESNNIDYIKSATNFVAVKVCNADEVYEKLKNENVNIKSCSVFGLDNYIRVTLTNKKDLEKLKRKLKEII